MKKLGIKPASTLALLGAPDGFRGELVGLPADVRVVTTATGTPDLVIWFAVSARDLQARAPRVAAMFGSGLWIAWPKKASGVKTDLSDGIVRDAGLANGLVDYKVCAINATCSGLKFARRRG